MLVPPVPGSLVGTFASEALGIGSFTTVLFQDGASALVALLIFLREPIVVAAEPSSAPFVGTATAQVPAAVLVTAILAPVVVAAVLEREGGLSPVHVDA